MKILKKYLLIIFISIITFLLVPRGTYAATDTNFIYSSSVTNDINNNQELYKNVANYIKNNANVFENQFSDLNITNDKVTLVYGGFSYSVGADGYVRVFMIPSTRNLTLSYNNGWYSLGFDSYDYRFTYNTTTLEITGIDITPTGINSHALSKSKDGNNLDFSYFYLDWHMGKNTESLFENNTNDNIIANSSDLLVTHNSSYNLHQFAWNMDSEWVEEEIEISCNLQQLGVVKNVSSFTYEVTGTGNALKEPLKGQFLFVGRGGTPLLTNNYNISVKEKNNKEINGKYEFQCNDEDIGNGCLFKYEYNYIDDIDTSLTLQFTFTSNTGQLDYEYTFYSCNSNNSKMNYTYIDNIGGNNQIVENPSLDNSINDDNVNESDNFLNDNIINNEAFKQDHGLTSIIQAPINFLQSLNNKTCSNIILPIPYLGNATIPCMSSIYNSKFNDLYNILKIIINGVLCYRMALSVAMIIKGAKDPNNDKIEVMDL